MNRRGARRRPLLDLRGVALLVCGICWPIYGVGVVTNPRVALSRSVQVLLEICPITWWGYIWISCGAIAAVGAFLPPGKDVVAFAAAALPPASWAIAFNFAWASGQYPQAWASIPAWLVPLGLLAVIAALSSRYNALLSRLKALEEPREESADGCH